MTVDSEIEKLRILLPHWGEHNDQHLEDMRRWRRALGKDAPEAAARLDDAIERMEAAGRAFLAALAALEETAPPHGHDHDHRHGHDHDHRHGHDHDHCHDHGHGHGGRHRHLSPADPEEDRSGE